MSQNSIIGLYTDLAVNPEKAFGWQKGLKNALDHQYKKEWLENISDEIWKYCAAVGNPFDNNAINSHRAKSPPHMMKCCILFISGRW